MKKIKRARVYVYIPVTLKEALRTQATKNKIAMTDYVEAVLSKNLRRN
jgi:hypothetical protein